MVEISFVFFRQNSYKKRLEYLFWVHNPEPADGADDYFQILEEGFVSCCANEVDFVFLWDFYRQYFGNLKFAGIENFKLVLIEGLQKN